MAGFASSKTNEPITSINVTPLVDIVLVLLIIFMVTAKLVVSRAVPMDLPKAATGAEVQEIFAVSLSAEGEAFVDGEPVEGAGALYDAAKRAKGEHPELRAVLAADGAVPHSRVMEALDTLRQAGIASVAFAVSHAPGIESERAKAPAASQAP